ncbi:MAG TPA: hypothetical protein VK213_07020 [Bacteroidales bacterium]|nr:hypothetical protein [Bacteroidales bacterium]
MIDRSNYELWLADWLDNRLTTSQVIELNAFLDSNPDLKEEFESFSTVRLEPVQPRYVAKGKLRKSVDDISACQFELLCAAYTENDLDEIQLAEFKEMLESDASRKKILEKITRARLTPPATVYPRKGRLRHHSIGRSLFIKAVISAAAAIIAVVVITGILRQNRVLPQQANLNLADTIYIMRNLPVISDKDSKKSENIIIAVNNPVKTSSPVSEEPAIHYISEPVPAQVDHLRYYTAAWPQPENLASSSLTEVTVISDDYRSRFGKVFAMTFREKLLKRDDYDDTPLKGYELAEAGITGLNKLLGWEMALTANNDEKGELRSLSFNSRTIKFNTPVRKNESRE